MAVYPKLIAEHSLSPKRAGTIERANAAGAAVNFTCGSFVRFSLVIDPTSKEILDIKFVTNGCGFALAAAEALSQNVCGNNLTELHGLDDAESEHLVGFGTDAFPEERGGCRGMAIEAFRSAMADFRSRQIEEFRGETPLICTCFGVSEDTIEKIIADRSPDTADEVAAICNAGSGCGSCRMLIQSMIDTAHDR